MALSTRRGGMLLPSACIAVGLMCVVPTAFLVPTYRPASQSSSVQVAEAQGFANGMAPAQSSDYSMGGCTMLLVAGALTLAAQRASLKSQRREPTQVACQARGGGDAKMVVIAGPPAAGKGTQCERIKEKFGYVHISTGDILRANVKEGTELGKKASEYMSAGKLVPSELIVDLVKDRLAKDDVAEKGCLLDGFPRAPDQAKAMVDAGIKVDKFILIEVPDDTLVERGCGRRLDPETGEIYHLKFKPPPAEITDRLVHRSDDQEEAIRERLKIYHDQVNGITPFFESVVAKIDGTPKPDEVTTAVFAALE
eukprot:TRINITY_DN1697_c0_g1_i1.p2 TRINITY_DN1697_c0_g1~~TRINITY_DN1697_c0_g1_i1.p2  ORF type:complete len:321 (-),score=97.10 TRINITY_DN1697_c0_g1_i1:49-978(-)